MKTSSDIFIIGTDEAGYGPNLGPLLVGASCWRSEREETTFEADESFLPPESQVPPENAKSKKRASKKKPIAESGAPSLFDFVEETAQETRAADFDADVTQRAIDELNSDLAPISDRKGIFPLVDSKKLYGGTKSLAALERSFLLACAALDRTAFDAPTFPSVLRRVAREREFGSEPWEKNLDFALPLDPKTGTRDELVERLLAAEKRFSETRSALVDLAARRVQPREFNALVDKLGLKSELIADVTTSLVVETIARSFEKVPASTPSRAFVVLCDKLGGRDRYVAILSKRFPGAKVRALKEDRAASVYRMIAERGLDRDGRPVVFPAKAAVEIRFTAKGEANAPTALASICAKYLRELSMHAFNEFWRETVGAKLAPTAGYPVDALRFRADVDEARKRLAIPDEIFWRKR